MRHVSGFELKDVRRIYSLNLCHRCHPGSDISPYAAFFSSLAMQNIIVEYFGQTFVNLLAIPSLYLTVSILSAHAAAAPWEGINALDAAFLAYSSISVLRQQIKPDHRVHGIIEGKNWTPNGN